MKIRISFNLLYYVVLNTCNIDTLKTHRRLGSSMSQSELESRPLQSLIYSIKNTDNFANRYLTAKILGKGKKNDLRNLENRISDYQKKRCEISSKQNLSLPRIESSIQTHQTPVKVVHKFNAFTFSQSKILVESESKDRNYNSKNIDLNSIAAKTSRGKFLLHFEKRDPL